MSLLELSLDSFALIALLSSLYGVSIACSCGDFDYGDAPGAGVIVPKFVWECHNAFAAPKYWSMYLVYYVC